MNITQFRLGELFCGPGGIACGAHSAKSDDMKLSIVHAWSSDYDPDTCATYAHNICDGDSSTVYCEDVRTLDIDKLGPIDAFAYGFPCNSFSNVGEHQGLENEKFGQLYTYGVEVLKKYRPMWFMAENVSGLKSAGAGEHFKLILKELEDAFGNEIINEDGSLNRKGLAAIVFNDVEQRKLMDSIMHKEILAEMRRCMATI